MDIVEQKQIADYVLGQMEMADPYCIVAGGAPRDWYFGKLANDLDLYYYTSASTMGASRKQIEKLIPGCNPQALCEVAQSDDNLYSTMPFLKRIWNAEVKGMKVQFIQLDQDKKQFQVVDQMDVSICQIYYKDGEIRRSNNFKLGEKLKTMWTLNECKWTDKHPSKMQKRFPEYSSVDEMQLQNMMVRELLKGD